MTSRRIAMAIGELIEEKASMTAVVLWAMVQQELHRRLEEDRNKETPVQCVICQEVVTCPEMTCMSCRCESLYHYDCLSHPSMQARYGQAHELTCPTCRLTVTRCRVSIQLMELTLKKRRMWSDAALAEIARLHHEEQMVLKDGEDSKLHQELYQLRVNVHRLGSSRHKMPIIDSSAGIAHEIPQLTTQELIHLTRGSISSAATAQRDAGMFCGICIGPLTTFSDMWSQGCLRCSQDTSLQTFYHQDCLEAALERLPTAASICVACGEGSVQQPFGVKLRLAELDSEVRRCVSATEVLLRARTMCKEVTDEKFQLMQLQREVAEAPHFNQDLRPRSRSPRKLTMMSIWS